GLRVPPSSSRRPASSREGPSHAPDGLLDARRRREGSCGLEAAVDRAVLAARVVAGAVHLPLDAFHQGLVGGEDPVREQVARALPAVRVARDRAPRRARQLPLAGEEVLVQRAGEPAVAVLLRCRADAAELLAVLVA